MVCKKCGAKTVKEYGIETCLSCGTEVVSVKDRSRFISANLPDILKDSRELGCKATAKKWRISGSTLWKLRKEALPTVSHQGRAPPVAASHNGRPPLPVFDTTWAPEVQIKWLEVWAGC